MAKKVCLTLTLLLMIISVNFAQYGRPRKNRNAKQRAEWVVKRLEKPLSLTAKQKATLQAIHLDTEGLVDELRAQRKAKKLNKEGYIAKMKAAQEARNTQIKKVLNASQKSQYDVEKRVIREKWKKVYANQKTGRAKQRFMKKNDGRVSDDMLDREDLNNSK